MKNNRFSTYVPSVDGKEMINRENVWHFYAYFASEAASLIQEFVEICDITEKTYMDIMTHNYPPSERIGREGFNNIMKTLAMLIDYYKHGELIMNGQEINFEHGDTILSLTEGLHLLMNVLPYLNLRHFTISKERYEEIRYHLYSFEELQHLDRTLAIMILPTFTWFATHSIFSPQYFHRMYNYPHPNYIDTSTIGSFAHWNQALEAMVEAWEWLKERRQTTVQTEWEDVPDEIYYGLHLFAEYLPEMQND